MKTRVGREYLRSSGNDLVLKVREALVDFGIAFKAVVESSNRSSEDVANKVEAEKSQG